MKLFRLAASHNIRRQPEEELDRDVYMEDILKDGSFHLEDIYRNRHRTRKEPGCYP